jgi:hypothetical protein
MATTIRARIYARGDVSFAKFYFCQVGLSNCWRSIFLDLPKLYRCQVGLPNCWNCFKAVECLLCNSKQILLSVCFARP